MNLARHLPRLRSQSGFSLTEAIVAVAMVTLIAVIAVPGFNSVKEGNSNRDARASLSAGFEAAEDYYQGDRNGEGNSTYTGFTATKGASIEGDLVWSALAAASSAPAPSASADPRQVYVIGAPAANDITLCSRSRKYIYCGRSAPSGPRYTVGITGTQVNNNLANAVCLATDPNAAEGKYLQTAACRV